jgi:hypothetical protein
MIDGPSFPVGARVSLHGGDSLHGKVTSAPAPKMRTVRWDDGTHSTVYFEDIAPEAKK